MGTIRQPFSVVTSVALLMVIGIASLLAFSWFHFAEHERHNREIANTYVSDLNLQGERILSLYAESLETMAYDYSWWDDMVDFVQSPVEANWIKMVEGAPEVYNVDAIWVYDKEGDYVYGVDRTLEESSETQQPFSPEEVLALFKNAQFPVFFIEYRGMPLEVAAAPIQSSELERDSEIHGYLLAARYWSTEYIDSIAQSLGSIMELTPVSSGISGNHELEIMPETGEVRVTRVAKDQNGEPIYALSMRKAFQGLHAESHLLRWHSGLVFVSAAGFCILFLIIMLLWVVQPLRKLSRVLEAPDKEQILVGKLPGREWQALGEQINQTIQQRRDLKAEVVQRKEAEAALVASEKALRGHYEEREQLARDLHDGIIQSVYAVGLQLETARLDLANNREGAGRMLIEARRSLNELIADVRRFISGLSPSRLTDVGLRESIYQMAIPLRQSGLQVKLTVPEALAGRLNEAQELHLFFIVQELLNNAARHSGAKTVQVTFILEEKTLILLVSDDGKGIKANKANSSGYGLKNLMNRADILDAAFTIGTSDSGGACITFTLPLTTPTEP